MTRIVFAMILCAIGFFVSASSGQDSHEAEVTVNPRHDGKADQTVRELFALYDMTLDRGLFSWKDTPVFVLYSDGQVIFIDPNSCHDETCNPSYLQTRLTHDQLTQAVRGIGLDQLHERSECVDLTGNGYWGESRITIRFWDGKVSRQVVCRGLTVSELYEACRVDPIKNQEGVVTIECWENLWMLAMHVPTDLLTSFRFVGHFLPTSAKQWRPSYLEVLVFRSTKGDTLGKWPKELPPLRPCTADRKWHNRPIKGSMLMKGSYLSRLRQLGKPGAFVALGDGRTVLWRYVLPREEMLDKKELGTRGLPAELGW